MQTISRPCSNLHEVFDDIDKCYAYLSSKPKISLVPYVLDLSFKPLVETFNEFGQWKYDSNFLDYRIKIYKPLDIIHDKENPNVIVCFSGGKDSIATALHYKQIGCNVYLYYLKHVNVSLGDEFKIAQDCADYLGLPLFVDDLSVHGLHDYMEHPMKNMIIANGALQYGIRNHIGTRIAFGNYRESLLEDNPFDRCAGDCIDMWDKYNVIIQRVIKGFEIEVFLKNLNQTLEIITPHKDLLNRSLSCLCRHSLRSYRHKWVHDKFNVDLPTHRCGSCYKCCVEYIYMTDHDLIEFNRDYYKYCINQLYKVIKSEEDLGLYSIYEVWNYCFSYDINKSKIYDDLAYCSLGLGNIKWTK